MFDFVRGRIAAKAPTRVVLDVGGVGYALEIPFSTCEALPSEGVAQVWTLLYVREDVHKLFGFATQAERSLFTLLLKVNGVGPTMALAILSRATVAETCSAIADGRIDFLRSLKGIGPKTAQRLVTELKDQVGDLVDTAREVGPGDQRESDAIAALEVLGCSRKIAEAAVRKAVTGDGDSVEDLVKAALKIAWPG